VVRGAGFEPAESRLCINTLRPVTHK